MKIGAATQRVWNVPPLQKVKPGPVFTIADTDLSVPEVLQLPGLLNLTMYLETVKPEISVPPIVTEIISGAIYFRTVTIPKEVFIFGYPHAAAHTSVLLEGAMELYMNDGTTPERLEGPTVFECKPGSRKTAYTYTECKFMNLISVPKHLRSQKDSKVLARNLITKEI